MGTITMGVDLAKQVFSVAELDAGGRVRQRRDLKRDAFAAWLVQLPPGAVVAMEACSGAHYWARRCLEYGLAPRLMAAQFVKPFRKSQANKNDRNDAEAIATAARQGNMRFVAVKTVEQQARLAWHRVREGYKAEGLAISNRLRGLLAEFGVVVARSDMPCCVRSAMTWCERSCRQCCTGCSMIFSSTGNRSASGLLHAMPASPPTPRPTCAVGVPSS